jgi:hypothetical protein
MEHDTTTAVTHGGGGGGDGSEPIEVVDTTSRDSEERVVTFSAIQAIHDLAAKVAQQVRAEDDTRLENGKEGEPTPNPYCYKTKRGLFLATESYPKFLYSPWGEIKIYGGGSYSGDDKIINVFNKFRESLTLEFVENICEKGRDRVMFRHGNVIKFYKENYQTPIAETELDKYRGTSTRIIANNCGASSIYAIKAINGKELPTPEHLEQSKYEDSADWARMYEDGRASRADWARMSESYERDKFAGVHTDTIILTSALEKTRLE